MIARILVSAIWIGALVMIALTSGCATGTFQNRIAVTLTCDRAFVNSLYGPFGITSELSAVDAAVLRAVRCEEQK